jgi:hypothetical protein
MDIGQIQYGMEIKVAWVTSQWQAFVSVLLILRVLKAKNGVLYHFLGLQYLSDLFVSSFMKRTLPLLHFVSNMSSALFLISLNMNSGYLFT